MISKVEEVRKRELFDLECKINRCCVRLLIKSGQGVEYRLDLQNELEKLKKKYRSLSGREAEFLLL